jgi:hypothetical protein
MIVTWMPHIKPGESAHSMSDKHLLQQISSTDTILRVLEDYTPPDGSEWQFLTKGMWLGFEWALAIHGLMCAHELVNVRKVSGFDRIDMSFIIAVGKAHEDLGTNMVSPPWVGDYDVHRSHRSQLIAQNPDYEQQWPQTPVNMPVLWPQEVDTEERGYRLRLSAGDKSRLRRGQLSLPPWLRYDPIRNEVVFSD